MANPPDPPGHENRHCGGKKRQGEGTCTRPAGWGTNHVGAGRCKLHGGSTRSHTAGAAKEAVERDARRALGKLTVHPVNDPLTELSKLAGEVVAWKELIAEQVAKLTSVGYEGITGEQVRAAVTVFERALDRCASVLGLIAKLDIDTRLARVSEAQAGALAELLTTVLGEMGLSHGQQKEARTRVAAHLRVAAG